MDEFNWPLGIRGENFYKVLEWSFISQEIDKYLDDKYASYFDGKKPEANIFDEFVAYALKDVSLHALNRFAIHKLDLNCREPMELINTVWENLGDCVLDNDVDTTLMTRVVLKFMDSYANDNGIKNPYSMDMLNKLVESREKRSREEAWEIMKRGKEYQGRLTKEDDPTSISDEIDSILTKFNVTVVLPKVSEVKTMEDLDFLCRVNDDEPNSFILLEDKHHITNEFLSLRLGIESASKFRSVNIKSNEEKRVSFVASVPSLVDVVMNLSPQLNDVKRKVHKNAKITK